MKVLIVVTGRQQAAAPFPLEDFQAVLEAFRRAGGETVLASPGGRSPRPEAAALSQPRSLGSLADDELDGFDAAFLMDGAGAMDDLADSRHAARVLGHFHQRGKPTGAVGFGIAALLSARQGAHWPYRGYAMAAPAEMAQELRREGAVVGAVLIEDRELVSGPDAASALAVAQSLARRVNLAAASGPAAAATNAGPASPKANPAALPVRASGEDAGRGASAGLGA